MTTVKVSPKYQIVIPRDVRRALGIRPGQRLAVFRLGTTIELVPVRPIREMQGFLKGRVNPNFEREPDREL